MCGRYMLAAAAYAGGYPVGPVCAARRGLLPGRKGKRQPVKRVEQLDLFDYRPENKPR